MRSERVEIIESERHADASGDRDQMNDGVRGSADGGVGANCVFKCLAGEDLRHAQIFLHHFDDAAAGHLRERVAAGIDGGDGGVAGQRSCRALRPCSPWSRLCPWSCSDPWSGACNFRLRRIPRASFRRRGLVRTFARRRCLSRDRGPEIFRKAWARRKGRWWADRRKRRPSAGKGWSCRNP